MILRYILFILSFQVLLGCEFFDSDRHAPGGFQAHPPEHLANQIKSLTFSWDDSSFANTYTVCLYDASSTQNCTPLSSELETVTTQTYLSSVMRKNTAFFVLAKNAQGTTPSNEVYLDASVSLQAAGYIKAPNTDTSDKFGSALSLSEDGKTLVTSAVGEASSSAGVNGNPSDNTAAGTGAAYVYTLTDTGWEQEAYLKPSNPDPSDNFGYALSLSGDGNTLAISALNEASASSGINNDETSNTAPLAGAVYLFTKQNNTWQQQAYIKASNTESIDAFGFSVSLSQNGDRLAIGAPDEGSAAIGVNGLQTDNTASGAGAVYVFDRSGSSWSQSAYLKASNTDSDDNFGFDVALSGDAKTLIVGAPGEDANASGINANDASNTLSNSGAAYVFKETNGNWLQTTYVKASTPGDNDQFGHSLAINQAGTHFAVSALFEDSGATTNGNESDNTITDAGAVYVFSDASNGSWAQGAYLKPPNADINDHFGHDISMNNAGTLLAVSSPKEQSNALGINGDTQQNLLNNAGAVYLFEQTDEQWAFTDYYKATNTDAEDSFGQSIALKDSLLAIGAIGEASQSSGFGGSPSDNSASQAGAVYLF